MSKQLYKLKKLLSNYKLLVVLAVIAIIFGVYALITTHHSPSNGSSGLNNSAGANSISQNSTTDKLAPGKASSPQSLVQGPVVDKNGQSPSVTTSPSDWITSASGKITLKQPIANSTLKSGDYIAGAAKVDTIQYRLKDASVGVIAQGSLNVVNGNFSGVLYFSNHSKLGELDIYSFNTSGAEINEVRININF